MSAPPSPSKASASPRITIATAPIEAAPSLAALIRRRPPAGTLGPPPAPAPRLLSAAELAGILGAVLATLEADDAFEAGEGPP